MLTNKLNVKGFTGVLESTSHSESNTNILFRVELIAEFTAVIAISIMGDFPLAFWASYEIHLALVIINDSLNISR
jgi:hypothetical protein